MSIQTRLAVFVAVVLGFGVAALTVSADERQTWDAHAGASGYDIERDNVVIVTNHPTTSYTDEPLSPGTEYCYRVRAVL